MNDQRPDKELESIMLRAQAGEVASEQVASLLIRSDLVALVDGEAGAASIEPLVVHRGDATFLAAFTAADKVPAELGTGRTAVVIPARTLVGGAADGVGIVVNPGAPDAMEIPPTALAALRDLLAPPSTRYFMREQVIEGKLVPVSVFRRRMDAEGPVDERLLDVDSWTEDKFRTVEKAIRFPLEADIEEISVEAAQEVFEMVARRTYTPLRRR
ncbi:hypothetical protein CSIV_10670 [Microbacterium sp. CSI-V]|uniref:SseB family protein n=1 Tax=unclassified Microbacterium TaxID=2609290 RepID=UPI00097BE2DB|nr:SseB family protein [Microbacterium sp. CSI-V]MXS76039.1 hypothetical protein [Microbacterium sp. TL13]ONI65133.1 hypothetical protein CSIV_10670 [Microbacterium sp. CSI-V]